MSTLQKNREHGQNGVHKETCKDCHTIAEEVLAAAQVKTISV